MSHPELTRQRQTSQAQSLLSRLPNDVGYSYEVDHDNDAVIVTFPDGYDPTPAARIIERTGHRTEINDNVLGIELDIIE